MDVKHRKADFVYIIGNEDLLQSTIPEVVEFNKKFRLYHTHIKNIKEM